MKRSKHIKHYRKKVVKLLFATLALIFISSLYARSFFNDAADQFIETYYSNQNSTSSTVSISSNNYDDTYSAYSESQTSSMYYNYTDENTETYET